MKGQAFTIILIGIILLLADAYLIGGIRAAFKKRRFPHKKSFTISYWIASLLLIGGMFLSIYVKIPVGVRAGFLMVFFLLLIIKVTFLPFILADDVRRLFIWISHRNKKPTTPLPASAHKGEAIPRSEFLMKAGLIAGAVPLASLGYGIISGAYDYHVRYQTLYLPNLPKAFDGIKLGQISDIHSGSFYNKKAVMGGVEMLLREKPDLIFFTGDLVNHKTDEVYGYQDIFSKVKAPLGVYSTLGNHDYGDYYTFPNDNYKRKNLEDLKTVHKNMGWDLLTNSNRRLKVNGEEIGILGMENWGALSRFPKYGRMDLTVKNTDDLPVKLLLSHDPSHWSAEVLPKYPQIDVMFSGHTHGMQFGVRTPGFQWSPVEYIYKEWAGLYHQNNQQLYVNVGYGFLGFPGRVGILPEITIFELRSAAPPLLNKA
ncbi:MAG: metallophosphoesterase [Mucilaginibacter sp.]|nr:metallophosphoesterase [Mucilaginibacter sp.]